MAASSEGGVRNLGDSCLALPSREDSFLLMLAPLQRRPLPRSSLNLPQNQRIPAYQRGSPLSEKAA